jgi:hypothetical protein
MEAPKLTLITGEEVTLPRPTMKMWRLVAEYDSQDKDDWNFVKLMNEHLKIVSQMFNVNPDDVDPADVIPSYMEGATYIIGIANEKLKQLPKNAEAEEATE